VLIRSGCYGAGFGEGGPLVAEVGDDLQAAAEGFDVGGQGASCHRCRGTNAISPRRPPHGAWAETARVTPVTTSLPVLQAR
jgi:hypothetical protein